MKVRSKPDVHLTYCLNVHPGETWTEQFEAIRTHTLAIRHQVSPKDYFGLGLRLSERSAGDLAEPAELAAFQQFLHDERLYVFTVNAFPYGQFHGSEVKDQVYAPDWRTLERVKYTVRVSEVLAQLLTPDHPVGSISTVPGSFKPWIHNEDDQGAITKNIAFMAAHLKRLEDRTGRYIHLGYEPEPCCLWETTDEFVEFFSGELLSWGSAYLHDQFGFSLAEAERVLRRYIGINFDCCHLALQFEDLAASLDRLRREGILISKIHLSAALKGREPGLDRLGDFLDAVYLHQVKARAGGRRELLSWEDLPLALPGLKLLPNLDEFRCHFHVPLYWEGDDRLGTTRDDLTARFWDRVRAGASSHLEVETYTFAVMPPDLRPPDLATALAEELRFVLGKMNHQQATLLGGGHLRKRSHY
jgi:hypothetical protein